MCRAHQNGPPPNDMIVTLRLSTNPCSRKPCWKAFRNFAKVRGVPLLSHPITGIVGCCARETSGHAAADPATTLIKSRRRIAFPEAQDHAKTLQITAGICDRRNGVQRSFCGATDFSPACPLWVKSEHQRSFRQCPLYPRKRTSDSGPRITFDAPTPAAWRYLLRSAGPHLG